MEENGKQGFGCLHHVVILFSKQQADPAAEVSGLFQLDAVRPQEVPQVLQTPLHPCSTVRPCHEMTQVGD